MRSLHFIDFYRASITVIALTMTTEGIMTSFDHGLFQMNTCPYDT